jgi:hypothetical protein
VLVRLSAARDDDTASQSAYKSRAAQRNHASLASWS